jgi:hypothetical protein
LDRTRLNLGLRERRYQEFSSEIQDSGTSKLRWSFQQPKSCGLSFAISWLHPLSGIGIRALNQKHVAVDLESAMNFLVIIPSKNASSHLDRSLGSVLMQEGNFHLHVHVQDSNSDDDSECIIERWQRWLSADRRKNIQLTFASENDEGLYDGIQKGFKRCEPTPSTIMTWLGSDDILMPGALATITSVVNDLPFIRWITGLIFVAEADCSNRTPWPVQKFARHNLAAGLHDGRTLGFVMQEGTFWRADLWNETGGVDADFKRASDWYLWVKFASKTPLYSVDFPLGRFSFRKGQLGEDKAAYHAEVDFIKSTKGVYEIPDMKSYRVTRFSGAPSWTIEVTEHAPVEKPVSGTFAEDKISATDFLESIAKRKLLSPHQT